MNPRDTQKQKLYNAERDVSSETVGDGSMDDVRAYVAKVLTSAVVRRNYPHAPSKLTVADGRGRRKAGARGTWYITLPAGWARKEIVVLHEIAHCINTSEGEAEGNSRMWRADAEAKAAGTTYWALDFASRRKEIEACESRAAHGWQFARILLALVRWFMGAAKERELKAAFRKNHVRFAAKKRLTDAQRQAAAERLRAVRAKALPVAAKER